MGAAVESGPENDAIRAENVSVTFESSAENVHALRNVDFTAAPGSFTAITGESGSGKSTLLNVLAGLQVVAAGRVSVAGMELTNMSERKRADIRLRHIGVIFQDGNLIPEFTALENTMLPLQALGWSQQSARIEALAWLGQTGIADIADRRPPSMSGGQRQRVGIARSLVGDRDLLLADEPTGSLDSENSAAIFDLFTRFRSSGKTIVVVTHDARIAAKADRHVVMADGQMSEPEVAIA